MPRLSRELIVQNTENTRTRSVWFYMNTKYLLKDLKLAEELDNNVALLRLLKDQCTRRKR